MAQYFFGHSPSYQYALKLRWIVGALGGSVVVLLLLLVFALKNSSDAPQNAGANTAWAEVLTKREIFIARDRIEQGMLVDQMLLSSIAVPIENIPVGAIFANDKASVSGKYAKSMIPAGAFVQADLLTDEMPMTAQNIPIGMRAVTITVDNREGVAGHVQPFSRVDVLCTYTGQRGIKEIATVVPFAKVFSVNGDVKRAGDATASANQSSKTVTLIVAEKDSRRIELARNIGTLSLSLVGDTVDRTLDPMQGPLTSIELFKNPFEDKPAEPEWQNHATVDGKDYVLTSKGWRENKEKGRIN